jgi:hypothetical protein
MAKSLLHLPLERYRQRYTEMLDGWESQVFSKDFSPYVPLIPTDSNTPVVLDIVSGSVLDSVARPSWALRQMQLLINSSGAKTLGDVYFSDFYTSGLDALAYCKRDFKAHAFCWAQSFDRFDFTAAPGTIQWMRPWEYMALDIYSSVFVASPLLAEFIIAASPAAEEKVHVVGLPFNSAEVAALLDTSFNSQHFDCVYTSRWDKEKNPGLFLALVESRPDLKFAICTGWPEVRGTDTQAIAQLNRLRQSNSNLTVFTKLTKSEYYSVLSNSRVQFNCAKQDWISFTLLEALTFGCVPLYPNTRSFPEALQYQQEYLYEPNNLRQASAKLTSLVRSSEPCTVGRSVLDYHDQTLQRISNIIQG